MSEHPVCILTGVHRSAVNSSSIVFALAVGITASKMHEVHIYHSMLSAQRTFKNTHCRYFTPNTNDHPMPLNEPPPMKIFCVRYCWVQCKCWRIRAMTDLYLRFKLRVKVGDNEIQTYIRACNH